MTTKDDDTLPLPGFSEELSSDITADEDFIPTSQPQSSDSSKMLKNPETNKTKEEIKSDSRIDDTLPPEAVINHSILDNDKSTDFIPDTETKKPNPTYANQDFSCRKKLPVLTTEDLFKAQPKWNESEIPESPALEPENISILNDTPTVLPTKCEESVTEIIVNDSAETVDLEATSMKMRNSDGEGIVKLEISSSSNSDGGRSEETQILDNSSVLLLDQPNCIVSEKGNSVSELTAEIEGESGGNFREKTENLTSTSTPVPNSGKTSESSGTAAANGHPMQKPNSTCTELNSNSLVTRKVDFKLTVSCLVTVNTKMNKVLQKIILNVNEIPKAKPKPADFESDITSDKSKRYSTSSSGSVYSDKMGPFALPKRLSTVSDQTDSSEEDFSSHCRNGRRALERVPWSNEYLLPLKMDDMVLISLENQEFIKRPNVMSPPKRVKNKQCNGVKHLKEILESSTSEQTYCSKLVSEDEELNKENQQDVSSTEELKKEALEKSEPAPENKNSENQGKTTENETTAETPQSQKGDHCGDDQPKEQPTSEHSVTTEQIQLKQDKLEENSITLQPGLPVFARWADKRYYSGVLCDSLKNDRWEVKFDDGTSKAVREDFLMPAQWLQVGALVFATVGDKYASGQIMDIKKGEEEPTYVVELDTEKMETSVKLSDLCLTDVMAGIIREKYKPLGGTPRGKADIDFDNVLSGKRLREQRTPLRPITTQSGNSGSRKKSSSKGKKDESVGLGSIKETPQNVEADEKVGGLKTENGHLVEDKVISADSQSGAEAGETPLRRNSKEGRKRAKPRSLSYEGERSQSKKKTKSWLAPDGTPIPGPSGVKFKKQKTKTEKAETPVGKNDSSAATKSGKKVSTESGKKKRKLDEGVEDSLQKNLKEGEGRMKTRSRKG